MAVKFLSEEWAQQVTERLNASDTFKQAAGGRSARVQQVVTTPDGEVRYYFTLEEGTADVALGELDGPDATITQDYDTAVAIAKNELSGVAAYMSGRINVTGEIMKLMQLQSVIGVLASVHAEMDVEY